MGDVSVIRNLRPVQDCGPTLDSITVDEAVRRIRQRSVAATGSEVVALHEAGGRFLAADVISPINVPAHDSAAMDGYAIYAADLNGNGETRMPVVGRAAAGHPLGREAVRGEAVRIFTGAPMPSGPDTVVMQEDCTREGRFVRISPDVRAGANLRRAGEDVYAGSIVLSSGQRLGPQHIALAAAVGCRELNVRQRLKVAVFSSGDELRDPGESLGAGQVHDANRLAMVGALRELGCVVADLGILRDDADTVRDALADAALTSDLVLTSGGMSDGEEDHVKSAVRALGALSFWSLAVKPGRPVGMGRIGATPFVGLPGNPVAAMVAFMVIARPMVLGLSGASNIKTASLRVRSGFRHVKRAGRREYLCVRLDRADRGEQVVQKLPRQGSHLLSSLAAADGLAALDDGQSSLEVGDTVEFLPLGG